MTLIWVLLGATWAGHAAMCFLPATAAYNLMIGHASGWTLLVMAAALVPQLILIRWAWRDSNITVTSASSRVLWRASFFVTGFMAITVYALRYRLGPDRSEGFYAS